MSSEDLFLKQLELIDKGYYVQVVYEDGEWFHILVDISEQEHYILNENWYLDGYKSYDKALKSGINIICKVYLK